MSNLRLVVLLVVCLALGALAWHDNRPQSASVPIEDSRELAQRAHPAPDRDENAESAVDFGADDSGADIGMDAAEYAVSADQSMSNPLSSIELSQLRDTVDRPLFASSRRRPPESAAKSVSTAASAPVPTFELLGVALGGPRPIAILRKKSDGTSYRVQAGDILAGWQVSKVDPRAVLLERPEGVSENVPLLRQ